MLRFILLLVPLSLLAIASCSTDPGSGADGEKEPSGTLKEAYESLDETMIAVLDAVAASEEHPSLPPTSVDWCGGVEGTERTAERHTYVRGLDHVDAPETAVETIRATLEAHGVSVHRAYRESDYTRITFGNELFAGAIAVGDSLAVDAETRCYPAPEWDPLDEL